MDNLILFAYKICIMEYINITLVCAGSILMILGILGCILPVLPGPILSYIGILLLHFTKWVDYSSDFLIGWALVVVIVQILEYYIPIWSTKRFGGGKLGAIGCTVGVIAGIFILPPWGLIIFPIVGAFAGEMLDSKNLTTAIKAGFGSFVGFLAGTLMQLAVALVLAYYFFSALYTDLIKGLIAITWS